jgi:class 3 adenylate cyclase
VNRAIGLPEIRYELTPLAEGGTRVVASTSLMGLRLRWLEEPFEWELGRFYRVKRIFEGGPFDYLEAGVIFHTTGPSSCEIEVVARFQPRHRSGEFLARRILGPKSLRDMEKVIAHAGRFLAMEASTPIPNLAVTPPKRVPLAEGLGRLRDQHPPPGMLDRLEALITSAPDVELAHIRPLALAGQWGTDAWQTLRLCLHATRAGLLNLAWEVLCPNCRSSRPPPSASLAGVGRTAHCEVCNIRFDAEFDKSVELKFSVHPSLRPVDNRTFCLAGPGAHPHVVSQVVIEPGATRDCRIPPGAASLRLRSSQIPGRIEVPSDTSLHIACLPGGFEFGTSSDILPAATLRLENRNPFRITAVLERADWDAHILTAARVTNWQEFRDLFASEIISPEEEVSVGSQVVLFTDLRQSTALYNTIGDAPAYVLVREHFKVLRACISRHHGAVVKTIGDAVMAVFSDLGEALAAVAEMHAGLSALPRKPGRPALLLKSALHAGPCLAVNANDRLDYFGSTINLAARLVDHCQGGDLTLSQDVYERSETRQFLLERNSPAERGSKECRGFAEPITVWRVPLAVAVRGDEPAPGVHAS